MLYYDRIDASEGIMLIKQAIQKNAWFAKYLIFETLVTYLC